MQGGTLRATAVNLQGKCCPRCVTGKMQPLSVVLQLMERVQLGFFGGGGGAEGARSQSVCGDKMTMVTLTGEKKRHNDWGRIGQQWASQTRWLDEAEGCWRRGPKGSGQRSGCEVWPGSGGPSGGA